MKKIFTLVAVACASLASFAQHAEWTAAQLPQAKFATVDEAVAAGFNTVWGSPDYLGMPAQDLIKTDEVTVSLACPYNNVAVGGGKYAGKEYAYKIIMGMNNSTRDGIDATYFMEGLTNNDYVRKLADSDQGNEVSDAIIKITTAATPEGVDPWTSVVTMKINRSANAAAFYVVDATKEKLVVHSMIRNHGDHIAYDVVRFNIEQGHEYYCMASEKNSVELYSITVDAPSCEDFELIASEENSTSLWTVAQLPQAKFATVDEAVAAGFNTVWGSPDYLGMPAQDLIKTDEVTVSLACPYNNVAVGGSKYAGKEYAYKIIMGMNNSTRDGIDATYFMEGLTNNVYVRKLADSDQGNEVSDAILKINVAPIAEGDPYCGRLILNYGRGNNNAALYVIDSTKQVPVYQDVTRSPGDNIKMQSAVINVYPGRTYYIMASDKNSVEFYGIGFCSATSEKYGKLFATTPDAIELPEAPKAVKALDVNAPIYNLAGQRVTANFKGIVLQNGQKYILH